MAYVERGDLIVLAQWFAHYLSQGNFDDAIWCIEKAEGVARRGEYVYIQTQPGRCIALTREGRPCMYQPHEGEDLCPTHARHIRAKKADA